MSVKSIIRYLTIVFILITVINAASLTPLDSAKYLIREDENLKAIPILNRLIEKDTTQFEPYYYLGICYQTLYSHSKACYYFRKGLKINPDNIKCLMSLGNSYAKIKLYNQAAEQYISVLQLNNNHTSAKLKLGKVYLEQDNYFKASEIFRTLLDITELNNIALVKLGLCAFKMGKYSTAIKYLKEAYLDEPENYRALYLLIRSYYKSGNYKYALKLTEIGLKQYPDQPFLLHSKATILFNQKMFKAAIPIYTMLINIKNNPDYKDYQKLGICYYYENRLKLADLKLRESYQKDSSQALTSYYLGVTNQELNNIEIAAKYLNRSLKLSTPSFLGEIYYHLASLDVRQKNFSKALENYKFAIKYSPQKPEIYYYIASIYDKHLAKKDTAIQYYQKYLDSPGKQNRIDVLENYAKLRIQQITENAFLNDKEKFREMTSE